MSWASYEDFVAEVPVIVPELVFCIGCQTNESEPGCDHCGSCLRELQ